MPHDRKATVTGHFKVQKARTILIPLTHIVSGKKMYFIVQQFIWCKPRIAHFQFLPDVSCRVLDVRWYNVVFAYEIIRKNKRVKRIGGSLFNNGECICARENLKQTNEFSFLCVRIELDQL